MKVIAHERQRRGLSQTQLSRLIKVHPSWVAHVEAGRWVPTPTSPTARRLVRLFGKPLEELLAEVEVVEPTRQ